MKIAALFIVVLASTVAAIAQAPAPARVPAPVFNHQIEAIHVYNKGMMQSVNLPTPMPTPKVPAGLVASVHLADPIAEKPAAVQGIVTPAFSNKGIPAHK